jgi:putative ribosome biogenesis GTPase RsgA
MGFKKKVDEIINSAKNLDNEFEDILELSSRCKFSNCTHTTEPDCEVRNAICQGILSEERFKYYYRIKHEAEYVSEQKNKTKAIAYMKQRKLFQKS